MSTPSPLLLLFVVPDNKHRARGVPQPILSNAFAKQQLRVPMTAVSRYNDQVNVRSLAASAIFQLGLPHRKHVSHADSSY